MLGLRRSGKRRRNRNQPRHPSDMHRTEREAKHVDRMLDKSNEESFPASDPPAVKTPVERRRPSNDIERPYPHHERRGNPDR